MKTAKVGDIVVVMEKCYSTCTYCAEVLGQTALVTTAYQSTDKVVLQTEQRELRKDPKLRGGFSNGNLFITGLSV